MPLNKKDQQNLDRWHGAEGVAQPPKRAGAQPNNLYPMTHGIWANQCLGDEERKLFQEIIDRLWNDFVFNKSSDFLQVELVAVYSVKLVRAQINGDIDASEKLDRMIRCHLKDLKATKIAREGEVPSGPGTTPAEWATTLLEKLAESEKKPARKRGRTENAEMIEDNTRPREDAAPKNQRLTAIRSGGIQHKTVFFRLLP